MRSVDRSARHTACGSRCNAAWSARIDTAIERYIDRHLHDRKLGPAALARAFGCSRSRLYELFQEHGGTDRYLRERRLGRCFRELATGEPDTRIWKVAQRWGLDDPSHFHRLFKQRFGLRPSEVLGGACAGTAAQEPPRHTVLGDQVRQVHAWFRSL